MTLFSERMPAWPIVGAAIVAVSAAVLPQLKQQPGHASPAPVADARATSELLRELPLPFEENRGQAEAGTHYLAKGSGYRLALRDDGAQLRLGSGAAPAEMTMRLVGAAPAAIRGDARLPGVVNYFRGADPAKWRTSIPTFSRVRYAAVYPGIDLVYYGHDRELEYDFVVAPGADPRRIAMRFDGAETITREDDGSLRLKLGAQTLRQHAPRVYQDGAQGREPVEARYVLDGERVRFAIGDYDRSRPLVIDPVLSYATYLGGVRTDEVLAMKAVADGVIIAGYGSCETSAGGAGSFPVTDGAVDLDCRGNQDAFVAKLSADGTQLLFSTYLGGANDETVYAVTTDAAGNIYAGGSVDARGGQFPVTAGAYKTVGDQGDGFVVKLSADGAQLAYATLIGGNATLDSVNALALGDDGAIYLAGNADNRGGVKFPTTAGAFDTTPGGEYDAFAAKLHPAGAGASDLVWSTYLGGSARDWGQAIAVDAQGVYVGGHSAKDFSSPTPEFFPTTAGAFQTAPAGDNDGFVAKLSLDGAQLLYSTLIGATGSDRLWALDTDGAGHVFAGGLASRVGTFPVTAGAFDTVHDTASDDAFVAEIDTNAEGADSLVWSTLLGGSGADSVNALVRDPQGNIVVSGTTTNGSGAQQYPTTPGPFAGTPRGPTGSDAGRDVFITVLRGDGSALAYSSLFGGSNAEEGRAVSVAPDGTIYFGGMTRSTNLPLNDYSTPYQDENRGGDDGFVVRFGVLVDSTAQFSATSYHVREDAGHATIAVTRQGSTAGPFQVDYRASSGTAQAGSDFTAVSGTLQWAAGEGGAKTFDIPIFNNDTYSDWLRTVLLKLVSPAGRLGTPFEATLEIDEDDPPPSPGAIGFVSASYSVFENAESGVALVPITRSGGSLGEVSVELRTADGTATAGADYQATVTTVHFADGEKGTKVAEVPIIDDLLDEPDETILLQLSAPTGGATLDRIVNAESTIIDDDDAPTVSFAVATARADEHAGTVNVIARLSAASGRTVNVPFTLGGSATQGVDYSVNGTAISFAPGETEKAVAVAIVDDADIEPDETVVLTLGTPSHATLGAIKTHTLTIASDDVARPGSIQFAAANYGVDESAGNIEIAVTRSGGSNGAVSVRVSSHDGTATAGADYTALVQTVAFADGESGTKLVRLVVLDDTQVEGSETLQLELDAPTGGATIGTPAQTMVTIVDDDAAARGTLQFSAAHYIVDESGAAVGIVVTRTGGSHGELAATFSTADGTAQAGADYTATSTTVRFADGDSAPKTVMLPIIDDEVDEPDETVQLRLDADDAAILGMPRTAIVTITDDDDPAARGTLQLSATQYSVDEGAGVATITVTREGGSHGEVSVRLSTADQSALAPGDYTATQQLLTFADGDSTPKVVEIPIVDDALIEGNETVALSLSDVVGATLGDNTAATLTIIDNDMAPEPTPGSLRFTAANRRVGEGIGELVLTVERVGGSDGAIGVAYAAQSGSAQSGADFALAAGTLSWADGDAGPRTITVAIVDDAQVEDDEHFTVTLSMPTGGGALAAPNHVRVTIDDNDGGGLHGKTGGGATTPALLIVLGALAALRRVRGLRLPLALVAVLASPLAHAESFYGGVRFGAAFTDVSDSDFRQRLHARGYDVNAEIDSGNVAGALYAGYWLLPQLGVELAYVHLGEYGATVDGSGEALAHAALETMPKAGQGATLALRPRIAFAHGVLDARAGVAYLHSHAELRDDGGLRVARRDDDVRLMLGLGASVDLDAAWRVGMNLDAYFLGHTRVLPVSLSVERRF